MTRFTMAATLVMAAGLLHAQQPSADDIVARHLEARGGAERLRSLQTVVYSAGTYREGSFQGSGRSFMAMARPYFKVVGDPSDSTSAFREWYDGSAWEWYQSPGIVVRTVGAANAAIRHNLDPDGPLSDYRAKGTRIDRVADGTIAGKPAYGLLVTLRDGFREVYFVDKQSHLVTAVRKTAPVHAFGEPVTSEERFTDYKSVGGILFPFQSIETETTTGRELSSMEWGSIEIDRNLPREWFSPPSFARSHLQNVLEQLYHERSDTAAIRWTYFAFRGAHPDVDTRAGIEVIGYQMLKMGDHAGAIAVLEMSAADYPQSSTSAFGLGRAYRASGDLVRARSELERALRLDVKNKRAADALASLPSP